MKKKTDQRLFILFALAILFCSVCLGTVSIIAKAAGQIFDIDAEVLPSGKNTYDIRLTIENQGTDWEGIVRLRGNGSYGEQRGCVYDTVLSLPAGSTKQFVVKIPKDSVSSTSGIVKITLLDKESNVTAQREFDRLLQDEADALYMGILSDTYSSLTYLDMGGNEFYYGNSYLPIKLSELNQSNLIDSLDTLHFLIIDSYDTSVLPDETIEGIWQWVSDGGMLIVGTGSSAEDVLSGLDNLNIECPIVYEPEEYGYDSSTYIDVSQLHVAEFIDKKGIYNNGYGVLSLVASWGNGAVEILPYALSELGRLDASLYQDYASQEYFVECILDNVNRFSIVSNQSYNSSADNKYGLRRLFYLFGNGSDRLHFGGLKWLVVLYAIFVGPILYLILRFVKKRDFYWVAVPISALVGILLIYWTGKGFEVGNTNVYSVTIEDLSEKGSAVTYLRCYDAGYKEWDLRLAEGYEYIGPWGDSYYGDNDEDKYYHHIKKEGDTIFFGMNPNTGFDDGYFLAGITKEPEGGSISGDIIKSGQYDISGTVSNETGRDFKYFAVIEDKTLHIYKNLPAGETVDLETVQSVYNETSNHYYGYTVADTYLYEYMRDLQREKEKGDTDIIAALGMGISYVYTREDEDATVIIGVTEDWDNVVDDNCSEVSYGCLYAIQ